MRGQNKARSSEPGFFIRIIINMFRTNNIFFIKTILLGILVVLIISIGILSLVPPVSKDALVHHLVVPKLYLKHGGMYEIPSIIFSYHPMNLHLLYMIPLYFGNDIVPKFIHFGFALLTAGLIYHFLKRRLNSIYALFGVIFFLSVPIILKLSTIAYIDLGVIFFSTAAVFLLMKWIETDFKLKHLILSAVACGLAMGTKYNGLVTCFLLTLFVPFLYSRYSRTEKPGFFRPLGNGALFFLIALTVFSPWMIRNYHWKNNPIYPFYHKWFNTYATKTAVKDVFAKGIPEKVKKKGSPGLFDRRSFLYHEKWWQIAALPVRIFFQGKDGSPQFFDGKLNPFLLFLPFFAFYRKRDNPQVVRTEKVIMLAFVLLFFGFAFFTSVLRIRYISPIIPFLVILSVFGVKGMIDTTRKFSRRLTRQTGFALIFLLLAFSLVLNAGYIVKQFRHVDPFSYISGTLSRDEYITKYRFEYPAFQYVNKNLPVDALILFLFMGKRGYYCDRNYIPDTVEQLNRLYRLIKRSSDPQKVFLGLRKKGVTHLLIHIGFFNNWVRDSFVIEKQRLLHGFAKNHLNLLYLKNGVGVFSLKGATL